MPRAPWRIIGKYLDVSSMKLGTPTMILSYSQYSCLSWSSCDKIALFLKISNAPLCPQPGVFDYSWQPNNVHVGL